MSDSILPARYRVPSKLIDPISLTPYGEEVCRHVMRARSFKWAEVRLACFLKFSHQELLIDHRETDLPRLMAALNEEIEAGKILHPFIWGRDLYDKAFEIFDHLPESLDEIQTARLLEGTPRGVFQSFDLVTGPLGILKSRGARGIPPLVNVPLYHCEKRSCRTVHRTYLQTTDSQIHKTRSRVREVLEKDFGQSSAFGDFFMEIDNDFCEFYGDQKTIAEVPLLGECFTEDELDTFILVALRGKDSPLRAALSNNGIKAGSPQEYIDALDKAARIQSLLLLSSTELSSCIDEAIHARVIKIPEHEIRRPRILDISAGYYNVSAECSRYGVRSLPDDTSLAVVRLQRLISAIYDLSDDSSRRDLDWRLRRIEGKSTEERLDQFLRSEEPVEVLRHLVLVGPRQATLAAEKCGIPKSLELGRLEDAEILNLLLWKLGFNVKSADEAFGPLRKNQEVFAQAVAGVTAYSETEKYEIKRESSPLFSSIESALDATLAFSAWALTFDHWSAESRFVYRHGEAREQMAKILNSSSARRGSSTSELIMYDALGKNTLGPLISGFARLKKFLSAALDEADHFRRQESEMPPYAASAELTPFAFFHTLPFLDLGSDSQDAIFGLLGDITSILESGNVSNVRNQLQHSRDDFPSKEELACFLDSITKFIEITERSGLCPMVYIPAGHFRDSAGRASFSFKDYREREYIAQRPSGIGRSGMPGLARDQFIMPIARIKASAEVLRFSIGTRSTYDAIWADWPKYRASIDGASELVRLIDEAARVS
ncbi:hypothetical protein [Streptomyces sp. NBC_01789]|uniref:hypothetical protein n=1 Tax=Streptomyces sp. NBC_01789 TaxID=2975941 RepID=UPI0022523F36|nr:hypothetical protein [Streptomyces sp. NBC_01789]MCX4451581.1 hypothetical protein [Streptomyces sp. NBC_01789]